MLIVLPFFTGDRDQAVRLAGWLRDLGGCKGHRLLLVRDHRAEPITDFAESFEVVEEIVVTDDAYNEWSKSANLMFRRAFKHIEFVLKERYVFWWEADVVPMREGFIDLPEAEYLKVGRPFMGDLVNVKDVLPHMSGVAFYPGELTRWAGTALQAHDIPWDVHAAHQIVPKMHSTRLIEHSWKRPPFTSIEQVHQEIDPETVLYHQDKTGVLIRLLREEREKKVSSSGVESRHAELGNQHQPAGRGGSQRFVDVLDGGKRPIVETLENGARYPAPPYGGIINSTQAVSGGSVPPARNSPFITDLVLKSYSNDYEWLCYSLRSVHKFATGFREIVIITSDSPLSSEGCYGKERWIVHHQKLTDGYIDQQRVKLHADAFTDADYILYLDSDTVFTKPVTPATFIVDGKPIWMMTPFASIGEDAKKAWFAVMTKFMGKEPQFEFMRRLPFCFPRWLLVELRKFCLEKHGKSLADYIKAQPGRAFSEFNVAGAFAYERFRSEFHWINTEVDVWPEQIVFQSHSWSGLTDEVKAKLEEIVK